MCVDDSCLSLSCTRASVPTILNLAVLSFFGLALSAFTPEAGSLFFDLALCLVVREPRLRHVRKDRPVHTSGGAFSLSFSLVHSERLAPFHRLPFTTVDHEPLFLHPLISRCFALGFTLVD